MLFVLKANHSGIGKAYLNTGALSAFPEEEEYVVGGKVSGWKVE